MNQSYNIRRPRITIKSSHDTSSITYIIIIKFIGVQIGIHLEAIAFATLVTKQNKG